MGYMRISGSLRNTMGNSIRDKIDAGSGPGKVKIYAGLQPEGADVEATFQTLLAELAFQTPSALDSSDGVIVFYPLHNGEALATEEARWARICDGNDVPVFDCDVGLLGSGATMEINTTKIVIGGPIRIKQFTIMIP